MEKILTIISEYNPMHFGHLYQLEESVNLVNPDYKVAIISGNFVQRGEPSIINKWDKTKIALHYGFDLVIELPVVYAISSAENFASGAIKIANLIGTTHLSFGSEIGDIDKLRKLSTLINNSPDYIDLVKDKISRGYSYPKSQEMAINELFPKEFKGICAPNNILGIEYLKAIEKQDCDINPITIKRNAQYASSSEIRDSIRKNEESDDSLPEYTQDILEENKNQGSLVSSLKAFEKEIIYILRRTPIEELSVFPDLTSPLVKRFKSASSVCNTIEELIYKIKNKSITQARIQRILLYILLNITKEDMEISKNELPYIRVLGASAKGKRLLSHISMNNHEIVTSVNSYELRCANENLMRLLNIDKFATDIYTLAYERNSMTGLDYTTKLTSYSVR